MNNKRKMKKKKSWGRSDFPEESDTVSRSSVNGFRAEPDKDKANTIGVTTSRTLPGTVDPDYINPTSKHSLKV
jgi:hypothetical protein